MRWRPLSLSRRRLGLLSMQNHFSPAPKPPPKVVPKLGELGRRPGELKRGAGELFALLDRYLDKSIDTSTKRRNCPAERDVLLPTMEEITLEVIGRPAADGRNEIKPALIKTYNDQWGEINNWRTKWTSQVQLYEEKEPRMRQLRAIMIGETPLLKLKELPEKIGGGGTIGKLVTWLATMRTWIEEEHDIVPPPGIPRFSSAIDNFCAYSPGPDDPALSTAPCRGDGLALLARLSAAPLAVLGEMVVFRSVLFARSSRRPATTSSASSSRATG
jgi:hypothetical protein